MKRITLSIASLFFTGICFSQTFSSEALNKLVERAKETHSSALAVYQDDKLIFNQCFDSAYIPLDLMSSTKSFVNLAVGLLITNGKIKSIDEPVCTYYPEWNTGLKSKVTIRYLLNHTSGLQANRNTRDIYQQTDYVQYALDAAVVDTPGTNFFYNNKAVNLLAGIVKKAGGVRMDTLVIKQIFKPLGITNFRWNTDVFQYNVMQKKNIDTTLLATGNPIGMAELFMRADDLAKVGLFVLHQGKWKGKQIIKKRWFKESSQPGQQINKTNGLLWWLVYDPLTSYVTFDDTNIDKLKKLQVNDTAISELSSVKGRYNSIAHFLQTVDDLPWFKKSGGSGAFTQLLYSKNFFNPFYTYVISQSKIVGYQALGYLGQYLTIFPDKKLVVARTISPRNSKGSADRFYDFELLSYNLVQQGL